MRTRDHSRSLRGIGNRPYSPGYSRAPRAGEVFLARGFATRQNNTHPSREKGRRAGYKSLLQRNHGATSFADLVTAWPVFDTS